MNRKLEKQHPQPTHHTMFISLGLRNIIIVKFIRNIASFWDLLRSQLSRRLSPIIRRPTERPTKPSGAADPSPAEDVDGVASLGFIRNRYYNKHGGNDVYIVAQIISAYGQYSWVGRGINR